MMYAAFMSVFITSLPMACLRQLSLHDSGSTLAILIINFWVLPGVYMRVTMSYISSSTRWYVGYVLIYFMCLLSILLVTLRGKISYIIDNYLMDPYFYAEIVASVAFSSVAIGDAYRLMFKDFKAIVTD